MAAIAAGETAPVLNESLAAADGADHNLAEAMARGPVLLAIYKSSCQASKTFFPFLERLHQRHAAAGLTVFGVSQDSANVTRSFARRYGVTFPILIEPAGYPVSHAFDIVATPTVYLIRSDGTVAATTMGYFKGPVNEFGAAVAAAVGAEATPLVTDADAGVPVFVPG